MAFVRHHIQQEIERKLPWRFFCQLEAAAPYLHFRKGLVDTGGRDVPLTVSIVKFCDVAGELETLDRLPESEPKTIEHDPSPRSH